MSGIRRALISVTDKSGVVELGKALVEAGWTLLSTGGTGKALAEAGLPFTEVADYTGSPEVFGGRVKTLHPKVHGGILQRRGSDDTEAAEVGYEPIDLVVCNLYAFKQTAAKPGITDPEVIEAIDIGGPSMIRSAAKNHRWVGVLTGPDQYEQAIAEIVAEGDLTDATRRQLAADAFEHTARYDRAIADWFAAGGEEASEQSGLTDSISLKLTRQQELRYGENPHQAAGFYRLAGEENVGLAASEQLHGKALSFNNLIDADIALSMPWEFEEPAVCILKHTTPSGAAIGNSLAEAEAAARACDPLSAFGGIVGMNRECDAATAAQINKAFTEVIVAPGYTEEALALLKKKKNLRLLVAGREAARPVGYDVRRVGGGLLLQERDAAFPELDELKVVTERQPTEDEWRTLRFAWIACKYVKSNAVLFANRGATLGIGAGQMSRVDAVQLGAWKADQAGNDLAGSVLASDAFFPFPDGLEAAAEAGATCVVQPGGSVRDEEVIAAANERGIAMVLTGRRHFRHA